MIFTWLRVTALHQDPHVVEPGRAVFDGVDASLELCALSAELCQQPAEDLIRVWSTHMDVVQPEQFWILHYFDARAPWVFHERQLEEPGHLARWRDDLDARRSEFFHLRIEVREREPHMIDGASGARLRIRLFDEDKPRAAEHKPVRTLREPPRAEVLLIPVGGRCRIGHVQMDVVVGKRLRRGGAGESPQNEADESRRKHDPSQHEELLFTIGPWF